MLSKLSGTALLSLSLCTPALAQGVAPHEVAVERGVFCDTQQEMERLVALSEEGDVESALNKVNGEMRNPAACKAGTIAYIRGPEVSVAQNWNESVHIVRVIVVGVLARAGLRMISPAAAFSIDRVPERGA